MKLTVTTFITLDGVMQAPGGADEDRSNGFARGGWLVPFFDDDLGAFMDETFARADAFLLGRTTCDTMQGYWSSVTDPGNRVGIALNTLPKHVATHRPESLTWENARALDTDLVDAVTALKASAGRELQVHGSHGLIQQLLAAGLVDGFNVVTFPVIVGAGKRLFGDGARPTSMRRSSGSVTSTGAVIGVYEATGAPALGASFEVVDGRESVRR